MAVELASYGGRQTPLVPSTMQTSLLPEQARAREDAAAAIARESGGSPFFVGELTRFVVRHGSDEAVLARLPLQAALTDHLQTLSASARRFSAEEVRLDRGANLDGEA